MITNKLFIKQCEKAKEIQKVWKPKIGDWYVDLDRDIECVSLMGEEIIKHHSKYHKWLPTQEQLWERIWEIEKTCTFAHSFDVSQHDQNTINLVVRSISNDSDYINEYFGDAIQGCLLRYIYETEYNKIWNGEDWEVKVE